MTARTTKSPAQYRVARIALDELPLLPQIRVGDTVFVAWVSHDRHAFRPHTAANLTPWRTNQSHQEVEKGWCGSTNGVDIMAMGRGVVVDDYGTPEPYDVGYPTHAPYRSLKVRLAREGEDLPRTFTWVTPEAEWVGDTEPGMGDWVPALPHLERIEDTK